MNKRSLARGLSWPWIGLAAIVVAAAGTAFWIAPSGDTVEADVVVYKTPSCGCCAKWVDHVRDHGMTVRVVNVQSTRSAQSRFGVPRTLGSCHTAKVGDYWIEGHVPADLIERLMAEQPDDIRGLTVPGMPIGSPGMEGPNPEEYEVLAVASDGSTQVYATRQGHAEPQHAEPGGE